MSFSGPFKHPRREPRFTVQVPVKLRWGGRFFELFTRDVSYRGLFLCTDEPPPLRQLISIEARLPPDDARFTSHCMSVYVVQPVNEEDLVPGVGVQFYAQSGVEKRKWEQFIQYVKDRPPDPIPATAIELVKRRHPRIRAEFEVRPTNQGELETIFTRDISRGGMFLLTDMELAVDDPLVVDLLHPRTDAAFELECVVRRCNGTEPHGIGVEFVHLGPRRREELFAFVRDGVAEKDLEFDLDVDPDAEVEDDDSANADKRA